MDVYSYGVLLCEMCIEKLPDPDPKQRKKQVSAVEDKLLRHLIKRCIKRDPKARPTVKEIIIELDTLQGHDLIVSDTVSPRQGVFVKSKERT